MAYRKKLSKKRSRRSFKSGASRTKSINVKARPMRGGIRL